MRTSILACLLITATLPAAAQQPPQAPACDRACLEGFVNRYLDAMQADRVDPGLFAREVKFTENGVRLPLGGEGLWLRMSGKGTYRFYVPDVETQQVAFLGTVREGGTSADDGTPVAISLRLRIRDGLITEAEQIVTRPENTATAQANAAKRPPVAVLVERMGSPHPVFLEPIPGPRRASREELVKVANYYFAGLQRNDGKGYYPFTDDCIRFENGNDVLANVLDPETGTRGRMGCKRQFEVALKGIVSRVRDRRFVAVDRERGIVFAFGFFDHHNINWTWQLAELFRIEDGQIRRIEAIFHRSPFGINSGWSTWEQGMSEEPQDIR